ncbi:MAG TPA: DUF6266 family protein, partial [Puia sp.]|nr:DUF6266 family protein [Puia sp.]
LNKAFENSKLNMTGFNKALSDNKNAVTGTYPDFKIDYPNVLLGKNLIRNLSTISVSVGSQGKLNFSLNKESLYRFKQIWTLLFIAAYEEVSQQWIYKINPEVSTNQSCELDVSAFRSGIVHTYAGFVPSSGSYTNSFYTGMISVI